MSDASNHPDEQVEWLASAEREAFERLHEGGDPAGALARIDSLLARPLRDEVRGEALAFRALLLEMQDRLDEARADLLEAHRLSAPDTFHRYGVELGLLQIAEKQGHRAEALDWCRRALDTVATDSTTDGSGCVASLIDLSDGEAGLSSEERAKCRAVLRNACRLRGLPDPPDEANLAELMELLQTEPEASSGPLPD